MSPWLQQLVPNANFQALVARGKACGCLTFGEVNAVLPTVLEPEQLAEFVDWLDARRISLIDDEEPGPTPTEPPVPVVDFDALPEPPDNDTPPVYQSNPAFEERLRALGVAFTDAVVSLDADGTVFDAELIVRGEDALAAWLALRNAAPRTGLWPVLQDDVKHPKYGEHTFWPEQLDPLHRQREWFEKWRSDRSLPMFRLTPEEIRAGAAQNIANAATVPPTPWTFRGYRGRGPAPAPPAAPDDERDPPEPDLAELFSERGPFRAHLSGGGCPGYPPHPFMRVRLYPTAVPWEVFAYLSFGGWNDCPWPDEQLTMLRHWHELYGVEVVSHRGDWYELFVPRPPRTRQQAYRLCQETGHFGEETFYSHGPYAHPDPVEAVRASHYWYFWWD